MSGIQTRTEIIDDVKKYLFFRDSAASYGLFPVNSLLGFSDDGDSATGLIVYFAPQRRADSGYFDYVELTVSNHTDAIKDIMDAINFSKQTVITIADDLNSEYVSSNMSATTAIVDTQNADQF